MYILFLLLCITISLLVIVQINYFICTGRLITKPSTMIKAMFQKATIGINLLYFIIFASRSLSERTARLYEAVF